MKILFYSSYYHPYTSGVTTYPQAILPKLAQTHTVTVLCFKHRADLQSQETKDGYRIVRMPFLCRISKGFISFRSIGYFIKECRTADVVVINLPSVEGLVLALLAKLYKKPILAIFHCTVFLPQTCFSRILAWLVQSIVKIQLAMSNHIVAYTKDYIHSFSWWKWDAKTSVHMPPIRYFEPDQVFLRSLEQKTQDRKVLLFAGRISSEKGIEVLIKASKKINQTIPVFLLLVGPYGTEVVGESKYSDFIEHKLQGSGVPYALLGTRFSSELAACYRHADVLVLPSLNQTEAFGMVQAEAMLHGTPVVASNLPGVRQAVLQSNMGLISEVGDDQDLAKKITTVLQHPESYTDTTRAKELFSVEKIQAHITQKIEELYAVTQT